MYRKDIVTHHAVLKATHPEYARWTIARLSGMKYGDIADRFNLWHAEPQKEAGKRVREFTFEIGLTLASSLAIEGKKRAKTSHERKLRKPLPSI
jgi:hypothetical protein